jgi:hypothetical protein
MPYITTDKRNLYADEIQHFEAFHAAEIPAGELNYFISSLLHSVIKKQGLKYDVLNKVMGCLECVKVSLTQTVIIPYEDTKILQNGNVSAIDCEYAGKLLNEAAKNSKAYTPEQRQALEDVR